MGCASSHEPRTPKVKTDEDTLQPLPPAARSAGQIPVTKSLSIIVEDGEKSFKTGSGQSPESRDMAKAAPSAPDAGSDVSVTSKRRALPKMWVETADDRPPASPQRRRTSSRHRVSLVRDSPRHAARAHDLPSPRSTPPRRSHGASPRDLRSPQNMVRRMSQCHDPHSPRNVSLRTSQGISPTGRDPHSPRNVLRTSQGRSSAHDLVAWNGAARMSQGASPISHDMQSTMGVRTSQGRSPTAREALSPRDTNPRKSLERLVARENYLRRMNKRHTVNALLECPGSRRSCSPKDRDCLVSPSRCHYCGHSQDADPWSFRRNDGSRYSLREGARQSDSTIARANEDSIRRWNSGSPRSNRDHPRHSPVRELRDRLLDRRHLRPGGDSRSECIQTSRSSLRDTAHRERSPEAPMHSCDRPQSRGLRDEPDSPPREGYVFPIRTLVRQVHEKRRQKVDFGERLQVKPPLAHVVKQASGDRMASKLPSYTTASLSTDVPGDSDSSESALHARVRAN